ncbi:unnamed protein product [Knipowitschia caucasica]|uniref:Hepatic sodium/bile acid cotransporter n=1 Tax=Knipowitschia caucasica TaxID=637954 RepID=A0AAV2KC64_KNICA
MQNLSVEDMWRNNSLNGTVSSAANQINRIGDFVVIGAMFLTMISLGCTMEVTKIKKHILKPKGVVIALAAQFGIMPLSAFCLAKAFQLAQIPSVVVLICGCSPGGLLSNIMSLGIRGDMNLSIVMTTCSTALALGMMPLLLFLYCQGIAGLQEAVPYKGIVFSLLSILIPCGIGILLNHYRPQYSRLITRVGLVVSSVCILVVMVLTNLQNGEEFWTVVAPPLLATAVLMPIIGYTCGYFLSCLFRLSQPECRTVSMETGCQNGQLCMALIKVAFPPEVVGPLFLFPVVYVFFQFIEALMLVAAFRLQQLWRLRRDKREYQDASFRVGEKE